MLKRAPQLLYFLICLITYMPGSYAQQAELWQEYKSAHDPKQKTELLLQISDSCKNQQFVSDSILGMAIETAEMIGDDTLLIKTYRQYFQNKENKFTDNGRTQEYANNMLALARNHNDNTWKYYAYSASVKTLINLKKTDEAIEKVNKAFYYVGFTNNDTLKAECFLLWGKCLEQTNNKIEAFRNYLNALYLAQKHQNNAQISQCYNSLSLFYLLIANYDRARNYKLKQIGLNLNNDSLGLMNMYSDLARIDYYNGERVTAENITRKIIDYAYRNNNRSLLKLALSRHRTFLIEKGHFKDLDNFYTVQYPAELSILKNEDSPTYYRVMAYILESKGKKDSANLFYQKVESLFANDTTDWIKRSNMYKRYAQFLMRHNEIPNALKKLEESYNAALKVNYLPYLIEISNLLDSLNMEQGNISDAYIYAKLNKHYADEQEAVTKQDAMLQMEIDNETKQRELLAELEQEHTERRHNIQYMGIIIAIGLSFIFLIMLGSFKVPRVFIRSLGFFSFIFFFEFIILIADHKIMEITHHEPWKMLAIKILIISMLLPFHHWIEHKVIHYLMEHQLIDTSKLSPRKLFYKEEKETDKKETGH